MVVEDGLSTTNVVEAICDQVMGVLASLPVPMTGSDVFGLARQLRLWGVDAPSELIAQAVKQLAALGEVSIIPGDTGVGLVRLSS